MKFINSFILSLFITNSLFAVNVTKHTTDQSNTYKISMTEEEQVIMKENNVIVSIDAINDSRCPNGKLCLWEGAITFDLSLLDTATNTTILHQFYYKEKPLAVKFANQNLMLMNVLKEDKDYKFEVRFIRDRSTY